MLEIEIMKLSSKDMVWVMTIGMNLWDRTEDNVIEGEITVLIGQESVLKNNWFWCRGSKDCVLKKSHFRESGLAEHKVLELNQKTWGGGRNMKNINRCYVSSVWMCWTWCQAVYMPHFIYSWQQYRVPEIVIVLILQMINTRARKVK